MRDCDANQQATRLDKWKISSETARHVRLSENGVRFGGAGFEDLRLGTEPAFAIVQGAQLSRETSQLVGSPCDFQFELQQVEIVVNQGIESHCSIHRG
jgi:hypothetical protein